jgi:MFS transporter, ACS family, glucarate transporter
LAAAPELFDWIIDERQRPLGALSASPRTGISLGSLVFARIVYAINWLNIGAIFVLMSPDLGAGVGGLGTLTATFYLGLGLMQIPGGVMAARWGPKKVVVIGVFLTSLATLGVAASSTVLAISMLRFVVGAGMALVFAPGVVIVSNLLRGKLGMGVGLFNSAFDFGGIFALFGWIVIAGATGWRPSLVLSGGLGLLSGVLVLLFVPADEGRAGFSFSGKVLVGMIKDRQLILLGLATLGFGIGNTVISGFMVEYLVNSQGVAKSTAGLVASLVVLVPVFTALWGGSLYDRTSRKGLIMLLSLLGSSAALFFGAIPSVYSAVACSALGGVVSGTGYTFAFALAKDFNRAEKEYDGLAIAWVNGISLTGSFIPPLLYSYLVETAGYPEAWLGSAALTLVFLVPLLLMVEKIGGA